ncbi:MAG: hypothetical protein AAFR35_13470 [Pseudomonadota bacterium]
MPEIEALARDLTHKTPLSFMLEGYGYGARVFAINNVIARHVQDAALAEARSVAAFGSAAARIWLSDTPHTPLDTVIRASQTQALLLRHLQTSLEDSRARMAAILETPDALCAAGSISPPISK